MDFYSAWPFFVCIAALLVLASTPVFAAADAPGSQGRLATLDGLRGFLALAVVFHHAAIYRGFLMHGRWEMPPSHFYVQLGPFGVAMFFMVTGYLFWSQLIQKDGRPDWLRLYVGRVFRIGPLYLAAIAAMLAVVMVGTGFRLNVRPAQLASQVGAWSMLGFLPGPDVNGYPVTGLLLAGVTWTLRYEWLFYLGLPAAALAARCCRTHLAPVLIGLAACFLIMVLQPGSPALTQKAAFAALFLSGMACASLHKHGLAAPLPAAVSSALVLALVAASFWFPAIYAAGPILLLGGAFYLITSGCTVFGLLASVPARRLGDISYGIYLLQGLALAAVLRPGPMRAAALASPAGHWLLVMLGTAVLVLVALAAHVAIERPGIALGKAAAAALRRRAPRASPAVPAGLAAHQPGTSESPRPSARCI